jgi:hypothetical protein
MDGAVVRKGSNIIELVGKAVTGLMDTRVPEPRWVPGGAGSRAMKAGIPLPLDFVSGLDLDEGRRIIIAAFADLDCKCLAERNVAEAKKKSDSKTNRAVTKP